MELLHMSRTRAAQDPHIPATPHLATSPCPFSDLAACPPLHFHSPPKPDCLATEDGQGRLSPFTLSPFVVLEPGGVTMKGLCHHCATAAFATGRSLLPPRFTAPCRLPAWRQLPLPLPPPAIWLCSTTSCCLLPIRRLYCMVSMAAALEASTRAGGRGVPKISLL